MIRVIKQVLDNENRSYIDIVEIGNRWCSFYIEYLLDIIYDYNDSDYFDYPRKDLL